MKNDDLSCDPRGTAERIGEKGAQHPLIRYRVRAGDAQGVPVESSMMNRTDVRTAPKHNRGFTLLELTCALFVITLAGFGAIQLYSTGLDQMAMMREYDVAVEVLRNEMELLRAWPFETLADGMAFVSGTPTRERLHGAETAVAVADGTVAGLKVVTVSVRWQSRHGRWIERSLTTQIADRGGEVGS